MRGHFEVFERNLKYFDIPGGEREALLQRVKALMEDRETLGEILSFRERIVDRENKEKFGNCENEAWFAAFVLAVEDMKEYYRHEGIPQEVFLNTVRDMARYIRRCFEKNGVWGNSDPNWTKLHIRGLLFGLGRLQFEKASFFGGSVLVEKETGREIMLPEEGAALDREGFFVRDGEEPFVVAKVEKEEGFIYSNLHFSGGRAVFENVRLDTKKWEYALSPGDPVLSVHIPADGRMDIELCRESFDRAESFFEDYPFKAYVCYSWLLDVAFERLLHEGTNIRKFQKIFRLFPIPGEGKRALMEAFKGKVPEDFSKAPRDTSLQRSLADFVLAGGRLHDGGGYALRGSLPWQKG